MNSAISWLNRADRPRTVSKFSLLPFQILSSAKGRKNWSTAPQWAACGSSSILHSLTKNPFFEKIYILNHFKLRLVNHITSNKKSHKQNFNIVNIQWNTFDTQLILTLNLTLPLISFLKNRKLFDFFIDSNDPVRLGCKSFFCLPESILIYIIFYRNLFQVYFWKILP